MPRKETQCQKEHNRPRLLSLSIASSIIKDNMLFNINPPSHYLLSKSNLSAIREKYLEFRDHFNNALKKFNNIDDTNYHIDPSDYFSNLND